MSYENVVRYTWEDYEKAVTHIAKLIKEKYPDNKIGLLGLARGGLPLLTSVSQQLDNRNIAVIHIKMSDENDVYSEENVADFVGEFIRKDIDEYVILEDIVVTGKSVETACKHLIGEGKKILGIYAMNVVSTFENEYFKENNIEVIGYQRNDRDDWVAFPWEKKLI